jgi:hypothetical protein
MNAQQVVQAISATRYRLTPALGRGKGDTQREYDSTR